MMTSTTTTTTTTTIVAAAAAKKFGTRRFVSSAAAADVGRRLFDAYARQLRPLVRTLAARRWRRPSGSSTISSPRLSARSLACSRPTAAADRALTRRALAETAAAAAAATTAAAVQRRPRLSRSDRRNQHAERSARSEKRSKSARRASYAADNRRCRALCSGEQKKKAQRPAAARSGCAFLTAGCGAIAEKRSQSRTKTKQKKLARWL